MKVRHLEILYVPMLCILLGACEGETDLVRGYSLVVVDNRPTALISDKDDRVVVDPNIIRHKVIDTYIVGVREDAELDPRLSTKFGYFIFSTQTGELQEGLDRAAFEVAAKAIGINPRAFE